MHVYVKHWTKEGCVDLVGNPRSCLQTVGKYSGFLCVQTLAIASIFFFLPLCCDFSAEQFGCCPVVESVWLRKPDLLVVLEGGSGSAWASEPHFFGALVSGRRLHVILFC